MRNQSRARHVFTAVLSVGVLTLGTATVAAAQVVEPPVVHTDAVADAQAPTPTPTATPSPEPPQSDEGPQFRTGAAVDVSGKVDGDVYASGATVTISGEVTGDVIAAAQTITITGTVDGNVRLAAQTISITGTVTDSGTVFAQGLDVAATGSFGRDVVGAMQRATVNGEIGRDVVLSVSELTIQGSVGGNVTYFSDTEAGIDAGAVDGEVDRIEPPRTPTIQPSPAVTFLGWLLGLLYSLVALSLITLLAGLLFPRWLQRVTDHLFPTPWKALLVGLVASIAVPVALVFVLVTIVGAPLALTGLLVWIVLTLASFLYASFYIGRLLFRGNQPAVVKALVGGVILIVALQIPWLNVVVWLAMVFFGLGAQLLEFWAQRPWNTNPRPGDALPAVPPAEHGGAPAGPVSQQPYQVPPPQQPPQP